MTLDELLTERPWMRTWPRWQWAVSLCRAYDRTYGEAPPITALLCCGISTDYARTIRNGLIASREIRPRTSCVRAWEEMRGAK